ncbi:hypothetical protein ACH50O_11545 [Methylomonas sp. 2BW1-5-20]|uniref:hypothetical protein n=1 Tax=Methylomonas sp. 2BW1-5-20 TaxID=3376686 RepID=UPI00404D3ED9
MTHSIESHWTEPKTENIDINDEFETWVYEILINGDAIDWAYWSDRTSITSEEAAKITYFIEAKAEGSRNRKTPSEELLLKVKDKAAWLDDRCKQWSLKSLVEELGNDAPVRMREAVTKQRIDEASKHCFDIQPLEPLTNEVKQDYHRRAAWSWVDAIYILQGYKPVFQLSTEQVRSHFPNEVNYFTQSMQLGHIGKEINQAGERTFIDSPANWQAFWQKAKHDNLQAPVETLGSDIKKHDISENKEFPRVIVQWLYDLWIEKGAPETRVFFRILKKTIGIKGSPIIEHWGAGSRDGGFHWKTGNIEDDMSYKRLGNIISEDFKKRVKPL